MKIKVLAIIVAVVLATGCGSRSDRYDATGTFEAEETTLSAEVNGRILEMAVGDGSVVGIGEQVALIDTTQLHLQRLQIESSRIALQSSLPDVEIQLAPLREQLARQRRERERIEKMVEADAVGVARLEDIDSAIASLERQIDAQRTVLMNTRLSLDAQIAALEAQLAQVDEQLSNCRVVSPVAGTVVARYVGVGELAVAGRPLVKIADLDNIYLRAYLLSTQLPEVALGAQLKVYADVGGGQRREYTGTVTWISDRSEFTPKNIITSDDRANMVYAIKVAVRNDGFIKTGMYGGIMLYNHD